MPFSLALSGGGCRGAAHIGVLMALYEADLIPESISGASAGAIVAGLFGCGKTPEQLYSICKALQKGGSRLIDTDIAGMAYSALLLAMGKNIAISGIMQGKRLYRLLQRLTNDCMLTDLQLPLCIAAVDLMSGETIAFSQKKPLHPIPNTRWEKDVRLCDAIYSSCCLPAVFSPLKRQGELLVDGGVADNLPVDMLHAIGARNIIAVDVSSDYLPPDSRSLFEIAYHSISVMSGRLNDCYVRGERLLIKPKLPEKAEVFSFSLMEECIMAGYLAAKEVIEVIKMIAN